MGEKNRQKYSVKSVKFYRKKQIYKKCEKNFKILSKNS